MPAQAQREDPVLPDARPATRRPSFKQWVGAATSPPVLTCIVVIGVAAVAGLVGADARWLAALGHSIVRRGAIPAGVPFASAPTSHWHNVIVLAELLFGWLESALGDRGLMLAQLLAVAVGVIVVMRDARAAGASPEGAGTAVLIAALGAVASVVIVRVQLFSLALFPVLVALLRSEWRHPSRRIWLVVPLIAVWSNLHGAVLIGVGVVVVYLALVRFRQQPLTAVGVGLGTLVALCATPAGLQTVSYYRGVLTNEAAARGAGLWAPLTLTKPLDVLLVIATIVLAVHLWRRRPPLWELVVAVALAVETVQAGRSGVWLLLFLAVPAARGFQRTGWWNWIMPPLATLAAVGLLIGVARGPITSGASSRILTRAISLAHGTPIVASDIIDEQVALAGGRIWVGNPIDAFTKRDQSTYLDWLDGTRSGLAAVGPGIDVVVTTAGSAAQRLMARDTAFARVDADRRSEIYARGPAGRG